MKSKGHFFVSLIKSLLRMGGCVYITIILPILIPFAFLFMGAEFLGIVEELVDKR